MKHPETCLYCHALLLDRGPEKYFCGEYCSGEWLKDKFAIISLDDCLEIMCRLETLCSRPTNGILKSKAKAGGL